MTTSAARHALVLAPTGRDAELARNLLAESGIEARVCGGLDALVASLSDETLLVLLTDEALLASDLTRLAAWVAAHRRMIELRSRDSAGSGGADAIAA